MASKTQTRVAVRDEIPAGTPIETADLPAITSALKAAGIDTTEQLAEVLSVIRQDLAISEMVATIARARKEQAAQNAASQAAIGQLEAQLAELRNTRQGV